MIHDKISNLLIYIPENKKQLFSNFVREISEDMEEGKYDIDGDNIYAKVMSYSTKLKSDCIIEAHDIYVDIQFSLIGEEGISVYQREELRCVRRDMENDILLFDDNDVYPLVNVKNKEGWFTLLKTNEAHRGQESLDEKCTYVKKCVIKIKKDLLVL